MRVLDTNIGIHTAARSGSSERAVESTDLKLGNFLNPSRKLQGGVDQGARGVAGKLVELMETVGSTRQGLTVSELSRAMGVPVSTAHRLAQRLYRLGWLECDSQLKYFVGLKVWEIAAAAPSVSVLRERARPFLESLHEVTQRTVSVSVFADDRALTLDRVTVSGAGRAVPLIGERLPLHASASGLVLLAHAEEETRERVLGQRLVRYTDRTTTDPASLRCLLADVRKNGHASVRNTWRPVVELAAPIQMGRQAVGAVGLVLPLEEREVRPYAMALDTIARNISAAVGGGLHVPSRDKNAFRRPVGR